MATFAEYSHKHPDIRMERRNGILQLTFHTEGKALKWAPRTHRGLGDAFEEIGRDVENKVIILTGTGDEFLTEINYPRGQQMTATEWDSIYWEGKRLLTNLLNIEVPMIGAINGPATVHAEIPLLCDIVLASETAVFQDAPHFPNGGVPGDGVHVVWPLLLGLNRGRYFLLTGQKLNAQEAKALGVVNEVLPKDKLLPRAWELAEQLVQKPPLSLRYSRVVMTLHIKRLMEDMLGYGLALEGLGALARGDRQQRQSPSP
jgi:enoyl-CoA hydratase/carnithine racemase